DLFFKRLHEQPHEQRHFFLRAPPVFGTERKQREVADAAAPTDLDHATYGLHTAGMAGRARQIALSGPPPIAVHNDCKMTGYARVLRDGKGRTIVHGVVGDDGSDRHDLRLLLGDDFVDIAGVAVGQLLDFILHAALVVLGDFLVLHELFQGIVGLAADVADRHFGVFTFTTHHLGEVATALFGERGHRHADAVSHGD